MTCGFLGIVVEGRKGASSGSGPETTLSDEGLTARKVTSGVRVRYVA